MITSELYERADDWSCATFWYEATQYALQPIPNARARTRDPARGDSTALGAA